MTEPDFALRASALRRPTRGAVLAAVVAAVLFGGLGAASILLRRTVFEAQALLVIDQPLSIANADTAGIVNKLNQYRLKYTVLANTPPITGPVAQRLNLPEEQVVPAITVVAPGPSLVLVVRAQAPSSGVAQAIANETSQELITFLQSEQDATKIPPERRIVFRSVATANVARKLQPTTGRAVSIAAIAAGAALIVVYVGAVTMGAPPRRTVASGP